MPFGGVVGGETGCQQKCLMSIILSEAFPMWFRNRRKQGDLKARGGVVAAPRRSPKFGPRTIETLEDRALMSHGTVPISHHQTRFMQTNLVADLPGVAQQTDPQLVNAWGLAASSGSPWWVSDNGSGLSTLYTADGTKVPINPTGPVTKGAVIIPSPTSPTGGTPTGVVSNNTSDFLVNGKPAAFIFDTEDGTIAAWNGGQSAVIPLGGDNSASGAVYKGLALASNSNGNFLYATNFHNGTVDVFDSSFHQVKLGTGAFTGTFTDHRIPGGFAPFGIQTITPPGSSQEFLVVTYAKQNAAKHDDVAGPGNGFVDIFDTSGDLIERVASHGTLNSPWGIAVAPNNFGQFSGDLLIGNFGDGRINAFRFPRHFPRAGVSHKFQFDGQLRNVKTVDHGKPITIDGLWSLQFGMGNSNSGPKNTLFFTAGPNGETDGLFGTLTVASM